MSSPRAASPSSQRAAGSPRLSRPRQGQGLSVRGAGRGALLQKGVGGWGASRFILFHSRIPKTRKLFTVRLAGRCKASPSTVNHQRREPRPWGRWGSGEQSPTTTVRSARESCRDADAEEEAPTRLGRGQRSRIPAERDRRRHGVCGRLRCLPLFPQSL